MLPLPITAPNHKGAVMFAVLIILVLTIPEGAEPQPLVVAETSQTLFLQEIS
jgi:hypothetical protein